MRLFIAIPFSSSLIDYLRTIQDKLPRTLQKTQHLHLTLKFLGDVEPNKLFIIKERLQTISFSSFTATLTALGAFPSPQKPRVIWVGAEPHEKILALQKLVDETLCDLFAPEQNFQSHITIAHAKEPISLPTIPIEPQPFAVDSIVLIESKLEKGQATYTEKQHIPLT